MQKIYSYVVAVLILLSCNFTHAAETLIAPNMEVAMDFNPNEEQIVKNPVFWSVSMECNLTSEDDVFPMRAVALKKSATLNGFELTQGNTLNMDMAISKKLYIEVAGSAKVSLINLGEHSVKATCNT